MYFMGTSSRDVLVTLMFADKEKYKKLDIANYYAERGKLVDVDATLGRG